MDAPKKISFRAKNAAPCGVCGHNNFKEEMLTGSGRLIAGKLTEELRRLYEPTKKYGLVDPHIFHIQVCPACLYSSFPADFSKGISPEDKQKLQQQKDHRFKLVETLFGKLDFELERDLVLGAASYILAVDCYHLRSIESVPTPKKAVCSMRSAWLISDLFDDDSEKPFDKVRDYYYVLAAATYREVAEKLMDGSEDIAAAAGLLGPAIDHNWAYDGVYYLQAFLTLRHLNQISADPDKIKNEIIYAKSMISRLYGDGKPSRGKPAEIINLSKDLYYAILEKVKEFED